jgi:hypothetical protein
LKQIRLKKSYTYPKSKNIRKIKCSGAKKEIDGRDVGKSSYRAKIADG